MYARKKKTSFRTASTARTRRAVVAKSSRRSAPAAAAPAAPAQYTYSNPGPWGRIGRTVGGAIGGALGGPAWGSVGGDIGGLAHYAGKIFGSGKYEISRAGPKVNSLFTEYGSAKPASITFGPGSVRIKHREYLGDVVSSSTAGQFKCQTYRTNPGSAATFPWLSKIAHGYQTYQLAGLVFEFKSASGEALTGTNSALGSVVMAPDYNTGNGTVLDDFDNKQEMLGQAQSVTCKPSQSALCGMECDPKRMVLPRMYISDGDASGDIRLTDMGTFSIATSGLQGTSVVAGELWVHYDCVFFDADLSAPGSNNLSACWVLDHLTAAGQTPNVGTSGLFGNMANAEKIYDNIGCHLGYSVSTAAALVTVRDRSQIPSGSVFRVEWVAIGTGTTNVGAPNDAAVAGVTTSYGGDGPSVEFPNVAATATISARSYYVFCADNTELDIVGPNTIICPDLPGADVVPFVAITNTGVPGAVTTLPGSGVGSITQMRLTITQVNPRTRLGRTTFA